MSALLPELSVYLCGDLPDVPLKNKDVVDSYPENGCENHKIVNGRQSRPALPLVDGLRGIEPENVLEILHSQPRVYTQGVDVDSCCGQVRFISFTLLFRRRAGKEPAQFALKL